MSKQKETLKSVTETFKEFEKGKLITGSDAEKEKGNGLFLREKDKGGEPNPVQLRIEFMNEECLADFVDLIRERDIVHKDSAVYRLDVLDRSASSRIKGGFILRRKGARPDQCRLVIKKTVIEERKV
jgi:hypothetical protein